MIDRAKADQLASDYFLKYVSGCGIPNEVKDKEDFWSAELWGGYTGYAFYGTLWIRKSDGEVFLQPRSDGSLPPWTMRKIEEQEANNKEKVRITSASTRSLLIVPFPLPLQCLVVVQRAGKRVDPVI